MKALLRRTIWTAALFSAVARAEESPAPKPIIGTGEVHFITVDDDVKLEVVDWGGTGRPLVLLAGLGGHAHGFSRFAPKLTPRYHVYSITRRGFAPSSIPASGYSADRLGDDVVAVIAALKLNRPVLAGHSLAGEELSSVGTRHPDKIAGLVYLDAGYPYALYDQVHGELDLDVIDALKDLRELQPGQGPSDVGPIIDRLLAELPRVEQDLEGRKKEYAGITGLPVPDQAPAIPDAIRQILTGEQKYTAINVPVLALFAVPHDMGGAYQDKPELAAKLAALDLSRTEPQVEAFERQVPSARVVRIPHASHLIYQSNPDEVVREMNAFIAGLP